MRLSEKQQIFSINIAKLILKAEELGIGLTFGEAYRTRSQQQLYYHGYKVINGELIKTNPKSKTLNSKHLSRLAVDFNFFIDGELTYKDPLLNKLGEYWESLNETNVWGGFWTSFPDAPHFQMS